jgi:uncharacterized protein
MISEATVRLAVAEGVVLDVRAARPSGAKTGVVLCHPHPLYGGDMDNPVVVRAAEVCRDVGLATLRFDFRGVGASTGEFDEGRGEQDDLVAAVDHLAALLGEPAPVAVAGLALIAPPLSMPALASLGELTAFARPLLVVAGTADPYCPPDALEGLATSLPRAAVRTVEGADHFFFGKLFPLGEIVRAWAQTVTEQAG